MEVSGQLNATVALPPGKDPRYPLNSSLGGPQSQFGHFEEEKKSRVPSSIRTLGPSSPWPGCYTDFLLCFLIMHVMRVRSLILTFYLVFEYVLA